MVKSFVKNGLKTSVAGFCAIKESLVVFKKRAVTLRRDSNIQEVRSENKQYSGRGAEWAFRTIVLMKQFL